MGLGDASAVGAMMHKLRQNAAMRQKRKSLKEIRGVHKIKNSSVEKPLFKEASPEEMRAFKLKLEKEKKRNFNKRIAVIVIAVITGLWAFYYIISG